MESPICAPLLMNLLNVLRSAIKRLVNLPVYLFAAPCVINNNGHLHAEGITLQFLKTYMFTSLQVYSEI